MCKSKVGKMYEHINPLLKKLPAKIIIHVGTNDVVTKTSDMILDELLKLKHHIKVELPGVEVTISCPITRIDTGKAKLTIKHLINRITVIKTRHIINNKITEEYLSRIGLQEGPGA